MSFKTYVSKFASQTLDLLLLSISIGILILQQGYSHICKILLGLDLTNIEFLLLGDINADMASTNYNNVRQLTNSADIYGLHQPISEPTQITDRSSTLIDIIFTNCPERIVCSGVAHISISAQSCLRISKTFYRLLKGSLFNNARKL